MRTTHPKIVAIASGATGSVFCLLENGRLYEGSVDGEEFDWVELPHPMSTDEGEGEDE